MACVPSMEVPVRVQFAACRAALLFTFVLVAATLGCEQPAPDRWSRTAGPCEPALGSRDALEGGLVDAPCLEAISNDFAVDEASFSADNLSCVQAGLLELFSRPAGTVSELEQSDAVRGPFLRLMRRQARLQGTDDLRQVAYNLASTQVSAMRSATFAEADWRAAFDPDTAEILVRDPLGGACDVDASLVLFHEAMHGVAPPHVDCPDNPDDACDRTWRGSYGLQAGLAERLLASCDPETEPERCAIIELSLEHATASVIRD